MILIDSHVHIYDCFDIELLLDSALDNFKTSEKVLHTTSQESLYVLLLTEGDSENWFEQQVAAKEDGEDKKHSFGSWYVAEVAEDDAFIVCRNRGSDEKLYLVAGWQAVTSENIEVLALCCTERIRSKQSLANTVQAINDSGGISVLPWGAGKWLGKRGETVKLFLSGYEGGNLCLGDNGGRPRFWPAPAIFALAEEKDIPLLPGSDPLPLAAEASRVGGFGCCLDVSLSSADFSAEQLKKLLLSGKTKIVPFGDLQKPSLFVVNQLKLRFSS